MDKQKQIEEMYQEFLNYKIWYNIIKGNQKENVP